MITLHYFVIKLLFTLLLVTIISIVMIFLGQRTPSSPANDQCLTTVINVLSTPQSARPRALHQAAPIGELMAAPLLDSNNIRLLSVMKRDRRWNITALRGSISSLPWEGTILSCGGVGPEFWGSSVGILLFSRPRKDKVGSFPCGFVWARLCRFD